MSILPKDSGIFLKLVFVFSVVYMIICVISFLAAIL